MRQLQPVYVSSTCKCVLDGKGNSAAKLMWEQIKYGRCKTAGGGDGRHDLAYRIKTPHLWSWE